MAQQLLSSATNNADSKEVDQESGRRALEIEDPDKQREPPATLAQRLMGSLPEPVRQMVVGGCFGFLATVVLLYIFLFYRYMTQPEGLPLEPQGAAPGTTGLPLEPQGEDPEPQREDPGTIFLRLCGDLTTSTVREMKEVGACDAELNPLRTGFGEFFTRRCMAPEFCHKNFEGGLTLTSNEAGWYCPLWGKLFETKVLNGASSSSAALCGNFDVEDFCMAGLKIHTERPMSTESPRGELDCVATEKIKEDEITFHKTARSKPIFMQWCKAVTTHLLQQDSKTCQQEASSIAGAFWMTCASEKFCEATSGVTNFLFHAPVANLLCPRWSELLRDQLAATPDLCKENAFDSKGYCEKAWEARAELMPRRFETNDKTCASSGVNEERIKKAARKRTAEQDARQSGSPSEFELARAATSR